MTGRSIQENPAWNPVHQITLATSTDRPSSSCGSPLSMPATRGTRSTPRAARSLGLTRINGSPVEIHLRRTLLPIGVLVVSTRWKMTRAMNGIRTRATTLSGRKGMAPVAAPESKTSWGPRHFDGDLGARVACADDEDISFPGSTVRGRQRRGRNVELATASDSRLRLSARSANRPASRRRVQESRTAAEIVQAVMEHLETALEEAGVHRSREASPPAIAFLDLSGYTRRTEEAGDDVAAEHARSLVDLVRRASAQNGGRLVKTLGDGAMFHFDRPFAAVRCGLELVERAPSEGLPPARVGVNAGPLIQRDGDYFGRTVNIAARVSDYARPNEVLATAEARRRCEGIEFDEIGEVSLKGVPDPVELFSARRASHRGYAFGRGAHHRLRPAPRPTHRLSGSRRRADRHRVHGGGFWLGSRGGGGGGGPAAPPPP